MIIIISAQAFALLFLLAAIWSFTRVPDWRRTAAHRAFGMGVVAVLAMIAGLGVSGAIFLQEKKGVSLGMSGGLASDARLWLAQHKARPAKMEVGDNIKIFSDGMDFFRPRRQRLPLNIQRRLDDLARIPEKPTRLLTASEQTKYYDAAMEVYTLIEQLGNSSANEPER